MNTKLLILILPVIILASCSKEFLDQTNPNKLSSESFWKTEADLNAAVATTYAPMVDYEGGMYGTVAFSEDLGFRTDQFFYYLSDASVEIFTNDANCTYTAALWKQDYKGIFYANQVIKYGGDMDLSVKDKYVAEAKFMRGLYYLSLVNEWGSVPIFNKLPTNTTDYYQPRSSIDSVWMQVVNDFTDAAADLPATRPIATEAGRATKGAALAYLGRAYLYQEKYDKAREVLQSIVDNAEYGYTLLDSFVYLFDGQHENNAESIFEIQYATVAGNSEHTTMLGTFSAPGEVGGWYAFREINPAVLDTFLLEKTAEGKTDPRAITSLAWDYPGCIFYTRQFNTFFDINRLYVKKHSHWWLSEELPSETGSELNFIAMRYADVLLMLAEAYTMQDNSNIAEAAKYVQLIRTRAKLADKTSAMQAYNQEQMMTEIRHQRQVELFMEGTHFFDLRRWGLLEKAIMNSPNKFKDNYSEKFNYYPIPQEELDMNPQMTQNPLW
jgi:starch-binding outer membrane protein, SusD/RagB family